MAHLPGFARTRHQAALAPFVAVLLLAGCAGVKASPAASVAAVAASQSASAPTVAPTVAPTGTPGAPPVASPSPAVASQSQTIHVLEDPIEFSDVKVGSLTGCSKADCQGDTLIGRSRMLDATTRKEVGTFLVNCLLMDPAESLYSCPANTITLADRGQIVFTETLRFVTGAVQEAWPIIGGTGEFLGATGTVQSPADSTYQYGDFVITFTK